jgi:hypothetical protein
VGRGGGIFMFFAGKIIKTDWFVMGVSRTIRDPYDTSCSKQDM